MTISVDTILNNIISEELDFLNKQKPKKNFKFPCSICNSSVNSNQKALQCDTCDLWVHIKCDEVTEKTYKEYMENENKKNESWNCLVCKIKQNHKIFPFTLYNEVDLKNINNSETMRIFENLPTFEIVSEISKFSNTSSHDVDDNIHVNINDEYYPIDKLHQKLDTSKSNKRNNSTFNVFHSNLNGLEAHFENLHQFLSGVPKDFDVINITETSQKNNENFKANVSITGYNSFFTSSLSNKGGAGMYVKNVYNSIERTDLITQHKDYETSWVEIKNNKSKNIICGCIYRHPRSDLEEFYKYLENCLLILSKENKDVYISGDFNIDLLKIKTKPVFQKFYDLLTSNGYLPLILKPTRVVGSSATVIDNIYTNCFEYNQHSGNILISFSEHFSQFVTVMRTKPDFKDTHIYQRDYSKFNGNSFRDDVSIQEWNNQLHDVDNQFNDFYWRLEGCVNRHAPIKKLNKKEIKLNSKPWITQRIKRLIQQRDRFFNRKKRQPNNVNVERAYKLFRNRVKRELNTSKKDHYVRYFEENLNNMKKTWEGIRAIINTNSTTNNKISQIKINDKIIDDPKAVATGLNDFFVNVGPKTEKDIPITPPEKIPPENFLQNRNQLNFMVAHISTEEVLDIIKSLNANKSTGPSSIPVKLLLIIPDLIILPLCKIINTSFLTGKFPQALKIVKVVPIYKGGSPEDVNNYRPISLLSIFDKIIEKLMHKRLYDFLEDNNILFENQFGFRKHKSTIHALIKITEEIRESIEKNKYGCGIFIDLRKAFDTVNHKILLKKLEHYGVRGKPLKWFESYLSDRKQYVYLNGHASDSKGISCGVPQGSVLGPLLFLIYINDLPNISNKLKFFLFADDTNIYFEAKNLNTLEKVINKELKSLHQWLSVNRLSLNIGKTNFVIFHPYNKPVKEFITIKINKKAIKEEKYVKYLGILIDSTLSFNFHIDNICKKISRAIGVMYKIRYYVNSSILKNLYYALIYPHILYGIQVWGSTFNYLTNRIMVLQKKCIRMMTFNDGNFVRDGPRAHTAPLFKLLNILPLAKVYMLRICLFVFECIKDESPLFKCWFTLNNALHNHNTRSNSNSQLENYTIMNSNNIFIPYTRTSYGKKSVKLEGSRLWNNIPQEIRGIRSLNAFSNVLKKYLSTS